jgi:hypothetical protein
MQEKLGISFQRATSGFKAREIGEYRYKERPQDSRPEKFNIVKKSDLRIQGQRNLISLKRATSGFKAREI